MAVYRMKKGTPQYEFHQSLKKIQMMAGGFGNGKSACLCVKGLRLARDYPGSQGLIARESYPKLNDTIRKEFFKWCPSSWVKRKPSKDDNSVTLVNNSVINFRYINQRGKHTDDGSTTSNLLSATYDWAAVDQVEDPGITYKDILDILGRLRGATPYRPPRGSEDLRMPRTGPRVLMLACNPTHNWVYKELVNPYHLFIKHGLRSDKLMTDPNTKEPIFALFEGSTYTNADNLESDFISGLEAAYKGQMRERFLMGKWSAFEGLIYADYNPQIHRVTRDQILAYAADCMSRYVHLVALEGYDFGLQSPSCYLLGFRDDFGRVFIVDGYHRGSFPYPEQIPMIRTLRQKHTNWLNFEEPIYADPDIFKRKVIAGYQATGIALARIFRDGGINMRPSNNDIVNGIAKVNAYLNGTPLTPNPFLNDGSSPMLFVAAELDWWHTEIENYFWKRNPQGQHIDEPIDKDDHAMDATKYMLAKLPDPSSIITPYHAMIPKWKQWHEMDIN